MDYLLLLGQHDDPVEWMEEASYWHADAKARLDQFCADLRSMAVISKRISTGYQDASYHADVDVLLPDGGSLRIRFSNFGNFVTTVDDGSEWELPRSLVDLLRRHGYVYVSREVLDQPYTGPNAGVGSGFASWFDRYFGCG